MAKHIKTDSAAGTAKAADILLAQRKRTGKRPWLNTPKTDWCRGAWIPIEVDAQSCIGCGLCELACGLRREGSINPLRSSIMLWLEDKQDYFGVMIKLPDGGIVLGRPEGVETVDGSQGGAGGPGGKPILLREPCDECAGEQPCCVRVCPTGCLRRG